jgi:hypothetical protein
VSLGENETGRLDAVNNAGYGYSGSIVTTEETDWD